MIRYGSALLIAAGATAAAFAVAACGDDSVGGGGVKPGGTGGASAGGSTGNTGGSDNTSGSGNNTGGSAGTTAGNADSCTAMCCPKDASCYVSGQTGPGAACLARIDNDPKHIMMRQTWINITAPAGNEIAPVLQTLNWDTQFLDNKCNTPKGQSGYMQAVDLDLTNGVSTLGYVKYGTADDAAANGVCFVDVGMGADTSATKTDGWKDVATYVAGGTVADEPNYDFSLPASDMSYSGDYPDGLAPPMPQPWKLAPTKAKRLTMDFDLSKDRETLLKQLKPDGDIGKDGYTGVFYYDDATGKSHGYSPVSYQVIYDAPTKAGSDPTSYIVVPIREAEIKYQTNDPMHPNCIGKLLPDNLDPAAGCVDPVNTTNTKPGWGGIFDTKTGEGDAAVVGYFLITELEQVYSSVLRMTLCVSYPKLDVSAMNGWASPADTPTEKRCRKSPKWKPALQDQSGLPMGDWCAHSNSPATAACHDAYQSKSFHAFQAYKIKSDHCSVL